MIIRINDADQNNKTVGEGIYRNIIELEQKKGILRIKNFKQQLNWYVEVNAIGKNDTTSFEF